MSKSVKHEGGHGNHLHEDMIACQKGFAFAGRRIAEKVKSERKRHGTDKYVPISDAEFGQGVSRQQNFFRKSPRAPSTALLHFAYHQEYSGSKSRPFRRRAGEADANQPAAETYHKDGRENDIDDI